MLTDDEIKHANEMVTKAADSLQNYGVESVAIIITMSNHKGTLKAWATRGNHYATMGSVHEFIAERSTQKAIEESEEEED